MDKSEIGVVSSVLADASLARRDLDVSRRLVDPRLNTMVNELVYPLQPIGVLRGLVLHADTSLELVRPGDCRLRLELGRLVINDVITELEQIESLHQPLSVTIDRVHAVARKSSKLISLVGLISPYSMDAVNAEHQAVVGRLATLADVPVDAVKWREPSAAVRLLSIQACHGGAIGGLLQKNLMSLPELRFEPVQL